MCGLGNDMSTKHHARAAALAEKLAQAIDEFYKTHPALTVGDIRKAWKRICDATARAAA